MVQIERRGKKSDSNIGAKGQIRLQVQKVRAGALLPCRRSLSTVGFRSGYLFGLLASSFDGRKKVYCNYILNKGL